MELDALIFGGGAAGLWLLDELHRRAFRAALIEIRALGAGQTIASQGILHGGLKYALGGLLTGSAKAVGEMTDAWRLGLEGRTQPDLREVKILSPSCYLWRSDTLASMIGLAAAKLGLRTRVVKVAPGERPAWLSGCPGEVLRVDEQVIDAGSFLRVLADRHGPRMLKIDDPRNILFKISQPGHVDAVELRRPETTEILSLKPGLVIFTAGEGNEELRRRVGLTQEAMQLRPLHMVLVRGSLPLVFGHCVDGNKTRVTVTSVIDRRGRTVWQIGGAVAEQGVHMSSADLIRFARGELPSVLPEVDWKDTEWAAYRINRAEGKEPRGMRPESPVWRREGSVITAWPTKLVLVPRLAALIAASMDEPPSAVDWEVALPSDWPRPEVARPPWEVTDEWRS